MRAGVRDAAMGTLIDAGDVEAATAAMAGHLAATRAALADL
jgi:hypothetical protein